MSPEQALDSPVVFNHRITRIREATLAGECHHLLIHFHRIHWFANIHRQFLLYRTGQLGTSTGDLDKLGDRSCFLPGCSVSQILVSLGFAYGEGREHLPLRSSRITPCLCDCVGSAVIQSVVLLQWHRDKEKSACSIERSSFAAIMTEMD